MSSEETVVWKGRSNQIVNFWPLVTSILITIALIVGAFYSSGWVAAGAIIPLVYCGWVWLQTKCKVFEFTSERIRIYQGVFSQDIDEVELYRVKDTRLLKPFWFRIFGLSTIVLNTSDRTCPTVEIKAVKDGPGIREKLRKQVEMLRDKKRVREVDFEGSDGDEMEFEGDEM
ncbi:MAG TPA: hypothetical protein DDW68_07325 [Verrucomicrobiales bacterium]|nr:hypothetical protein [Verrucomicrobiales bacterium]HBE96968.1 hypothetical protein [Verrucomicrobiales bacterium]